MESSHLGMSSVSYGQKVYTRKNSLKQKQTYFRIHFNGLIPNAAPLPQ